MRKAFMGVRLKRLREQRGMKQVELAATLGISPSYLNQIEQNQRPITGPVMLKLERVFGDDARQFASDDESRLVADLRAALADGPEAVSMAEIRELAASMPAIGRTLVSLHQRYREVVERSEAMAAQLGDEWISGGPARAPFEQVRDFFYARRNHVEQLDEAAEQLYHAAGLGPLSVHAGLVAWLRERHGVQVVITDSDDVQRHFDAATRKLFISADLKLGQQAFQMGAQIACLALPGVIDRLLDDPILSSVDARRLARIGLVNYFAGALVLPYEDFLAAAEAEAYDIEKLGRRYGVGFETVCHRLSTMQRPGARGVPFFFVRVDRAGNISKRQSATDFHFSRVGGSCPLWNVYEAFAQPGRVLTQVARMPDGRAYLWIARTVGRGVAGYGAPGKTFAVGVGCDIRHAPRLVYARGIDLNDPEAATPIGSGCKVCERPACPQRAFPPVGRQLAVDENRSTLAPYPLAEIS